MKKFASLMAPAILLTTQAANAAVVNINTITFHEDGSQTITNVIEPRLDTERARYQTALDTPTGSANVIFAVEQRDDNEWTSSCRVVQPASDKQYFEIVNDMRVPTTARSNVSYQFVKVSDQDTVDAFNMMGFPIVDGGQINYSDATIQMRTADVAHDGASDYLMTPWNGQSSAMLDMMLDGLPNQSQAMSHDKLVVTDYAGGQSVRAVFEDCLTNYVGNPDQVGAAITQADDEMRIEFDVVPDASDTFKSTLIANTRDEISAMLQNTDLDDVDVVKARTVIGADLHTIDGLQFINSGTGHRHVTFGCYAQLEYDRNDILVSISGSQTVIGSLAQSACLDDSTAVAKRSVQTHNLPNTPIIDTVSLVTKFAQTTYKSILPDPDTPNKWEYDPKKPGGPIIVTTPDPKTELPPSAVSIVASIVNYAPVLAGMGLLGYAVNRRRRFDEVRPNRLSYNG